LTKVILPEGITSIDTDTFCFCPLLEEVNIPSTVTSIPDGTSNAVFEDCPKLSVTSKSEKVPVDECGNVYIYSELLWLCEKTAPVNTIREGTTSIGSGPGPLYDSAATTIVFPVSLTYRIWVNSFRGEFPNLQEFRVDYPTYETFNAVFKYYRKDSEKQQVAGLFAKLREETYPIKLNVPAAYVSEYATAVEDYGFSEVITH